jgi:SLBB domain-containing protein
MLRKLAVIFFAVALTVLLGAFSIRAQGPANKTSVGDDSNVKPCMVVDGAVKSPTRFELRRQVRLAEALFFAGGLTEAADGSIMVVHSGRECFQYRGRYQNAKDFTMPVKLESFEVAALMRGEEKANPVLNPGDVVIVSEFPPVFVTGNVKHQKEIILKESLTLTQAIELAGGVLPDAAKWIFVYRAIGDKIGAEQLRYELKKIKKLGVADLPLRPYDIIEVSSKRGHGYGIPIFGVSRQLAVGIIR